MSAEIVDVPVKKVRAPKYVFKRELVPICFDTKEKLQTFVDAWNICPICSPMALAIFIVLFCARKQEAHSLNLDESGTMLVGSLKKRGEGQDQRFPLTVCVTPESAKAYLMNWRLFAPEMITAVIRKLEAGCHDMGFTNCSTLRETGAWLIQESEPDESKRPELRRLALRGAAPKPKKPNTKRKMAEAFKALDQDGQIEVLEFAQKRNKTV